LNGARPPADGTGYTPVAALACSGYVVAAICDHDSMLVIGRTVVKWEIEENCGYVRKF